MAARSATAPSSTEPGAMPETFDKLGVRFQYPENWILDEKDALEGDNSVSVYSPDGAFWTLIIHPAGRDPGDLAGAALRAMQQEYEQLDAESVLETVGGRELVGFDLNFYCLDLTNTAMLRAFSTPAASCLILCQAEDREFAEVETVFRAITQSLLKLSD
jgi:hypothetical protein